MLDNALYSNIREVLLERLQLVWPLIDVLQTPQPTQQGLDFAPRVYMQKITDHRHGFPRQDLKLKYEPTDPLPENLIPNTSVQVIESRIQFSALMLQDPQDLSLPTASDIVNYTAILLGAEGVVTEFRKRGLMIQRSIVVANPYFQQDMDQFEARPSFDVIFQHSRSFLDSVPKVNIYEAKIYAV